MPPMETIIALMIVWVFGQATQNIIINQISKFINLHKSILYVPFFRVHYKIHRVIFGE